MLLIIFVVDLAGELIQLLFIRPYYQLISNVTIVPVEILPDPASYRFLF